MKAIRSLTPDQRIFFFTPTRLDCRRITESIMATSTAETRTAVSTATTAAQRTRQLLFKEIVSTEQTYVQALTTLTSAYEQPLIQAAATADPILTQQQITVLFANARLLTTLHTNFLSALTSALAKSAELGGDEFIAFSPYFKMYTPYANNYAAATSLLLSELMSPTNKKSPSFPQVHRQAADVHSGASHHADPANTALSPTIRSAHQTQRRHCGGWRVR